MSGKSRPEKALHPTIDAALTGLLGGLAVGTFWVVLGLLGSGIAWLLSARFDNDPTFLTLLVSVAGFAVAGLLLAVLAVPLARVPGGTYLLFSLAVFVVIFFSTLTDEGGPAERSAGYWIGAVLLAVVIGAGGRYMLGRYLS